ncbi:hypothetical protein GCM10029992_40130 [Glycomyces albus]
MNPGEQGTFEDLGLPAKITAALAEQGIEVPFPIQAATIPDALAGRDVLGRGRTGSGKTLAFGLPVLARLAAGGRTKPGKPRAVILSPTRELAIQIADALQAFGDAVGMEMKVVCGGTAFSRQIDALRGGVDMLVATPGRLRDLIRRRECSSRTSRSPSSTRPTRWPTWASCPRSRSCSTCSRPVDSGCSSRPRWRRRSTSWSASTCRTRSSTRWTRRPARSPR